MRVILPGMTTKNAPTAWIYEQTSLLRDILIYVPTDVDEDLGCPRSCYRQIVDSFSDGSDDLNIL
jgi:hypothetical protein